MVPFSRNVIALLYLCHDVPSIEYCNIFVPMSVFVIISTATSAFVNPLGFSLNSISLSCRSGGGFSPCFPIYSTLFSVISYTYPSFVITLKVVVSFSTTVAPSSVSPFLISSSIACLYRLINSSALRFSITFSGLSPFPIISNISLYSAFFVSSPATDAFFNIPFSPVNVAMLIPAKINKTMIVITSAINVIPYCLFILFSSFVSFYYSLCKK